MSIESVMLSNHLILCRPLLLLSIFPSIRVFSNEVDIIDARMFIASINSKCPPDIMFLILPKMKVSVTQLCPTLCDSMDFSPPGSSVHGILQTILEWVTMPFSRYLPDIGSNPGLQHCRQIFFYHLSHQGSPAVPSRTIKKQTSIPSLSNNHPQHFSRERKQLISLFRVSTVLFFNVLNP